MGQRQSFAQKVASSHRKLSVSAGAPDRRSRADEPFGFYRAAPLVQRRAHTFSILGHNDGLRSLHPDHGVAGDNRLASRLQEAELLPIASRIRDAIAHRPLDASQLLQCVNHLLKMAGNPKLMSPSVATTTE